MMSYIDKRFPFDAYPKGWFQAAYSREVDTGQIAGLHYFGRRLICYRGDSGSPYVLDAYSPHPENKIYRDRPPLARGESAITEFRAWARQSYEEAPS
jgi:hypothetical protein